MQTGVVPSTSETAACGELQARAAGATARPGVGRIRPRREQGVPHFDGPISRLGLPMELLHVLKQARVRSGPRTGWPTSPGIVAAPTHAQRVTQPGKPVLRLMRSDKLILPATEAYRLTSWPGSDTGRSHGALEYGFRPGCAGGWPAISDSHGRRQLESAESLTGGRVSYVRCDDEPGVRSGVGRPVETGRSRWIMGRNSSRERWKIGRIARSVQLDSIRPGDPWEMPSLKHLTGCCAMNV